MAKEKKLSPMMTHYLQIKQQNSDCILFYRLGDFYEMFFEDAVKVSKLLDLTLTGRDCGLDERAPMCGVPFHAADTYIAKLVSMGEKVAICEQLENASDKNDRSLVERGVIKIVSAGTITENTLLDERKNNYIVSVSFLNGIYSLAWSDITTGDFYVTKLSENTQKSQVIDQLTRISPAEIICSQEVFNNFNNLKESSLGLLPKFNLYKEWAFNPTHAETTLKEYFEVINLSCFSLENEKNLISCAGALIEYLKETQKQCLKNINKITIEQNSDYMLLDASAIRNLELTKTLRDGKRYGSLLWALDNTETAMGSRLMSSYLNAPLQNIQKINYRLCGVEELFNNSLVLNAVKDILKDIKDIERLSGKIASNTITPRDTLTLASSLSILPSLKFTLSGAKSQILKDVYNYINDFTDLSSLITKAINPDAPLNLKDGGYIADGFDAELDRLRAISKNSKGALLEIEERERQATGIKNLKVNFNKVFGYYIEVTNSFKDKVPYSYIRKQTLVGSERFITEELKILEEEILTAKEKIVKIESDIFNKIKQVLLQNIKGMQDTAKAIAVLDVIGAFAKNAKKFNYKRPVIKNFGEQLKIESGRHPVIEAISNEQFIPNDSLLDNEGNRMLIITGPNMAGKSTYMRQVALITLMAHIGSFVPCKYAEIPLTDKIFTRVGASDNLIFDQSTFMVEMNEVASILNKATKNSLIILDEVGRGTSTYDGLSIAWAVVEYITEKIKAKTLFATHYHELSELEGKLEGVKNYKVTVKEYNGSIIFLRKIQEGSANKSFGIEVASLAGVPKQITINAKAILKKLEKTGLNTPTTQVEVQPIESGAKNDVIKALEEVDVDLLSPREALELIYELKGKIR